MSEFFPVATVDQLPPGTILACMVGGKEIAVVNCDGTLYAISNVCSHEYAQLSEGELDSDDCTIECPLHGAIFALRTGKVRALPATEPIPVYAVKVVDDTVQIAVS
ncbi:MAG: non-heme iron oxygenase ferredoxin subunit [Herpetosiphonaceae bacterium]|nr:non-heme iron oxygenase ferredoxin subunit [Herpetosiphonaceae bacterium]